MRALRVSYPGLVSGSVTKTIFDCIGGNIVERQAYMPNKAHINS